jgi:hypothetical protein
MAALGRRYSVKATLSLLVSLPAYRAIEKAGLTIWNMTGRNRA